MGTKRSAKTSKATDVAWSIESLRKVDALILAHNDNVAPGSAAELRMIPEATRLRRLRTQLEAAGKKRERRLAVAAGEFLADALMLLRAERAQLVHLGNDALATGEHEVVADCLREIENLDDAFAAASGAAAHVERARERYRRAQLFAALPYLDRAVTGAPPAGVALESLARTLDADPDVVAGLIADEEVRLTRKLKGPREASLAIIGKLLGGLTVRTVRRSQSTLKPGPALEVLANEKFEAPPITVGGLAGAADMGKN